MKRIGRDDEGPEGGGAFMPMMMLLLSLKQPTTLLTWFHTHSTVL